MYMCISALMFKSVCVYLCLQVLVADVRKWIGDVENCLSQSSVSVDGIGGLQCELRESQVSGVN